MSVDRPHVAGDPLGSHYDSVVLLSGGLDSTVLLSSVLTDRPSRPLGLHFQLELRSPELQAARSIASSLGVPLRVIDVGPFLVACQSHRESHHLLFGSFVLFGMALAFANEHQIGTVAAGINGWDADREVEHSPDFFAWMEYGTRLLGVQSKLVLPFQGWPKMRIVQEGVRVGAPLGLSWSCVSPRGGVHDGQCHACLERREAFRLAGVPDPTRYAAGRASEPWRDG